MAKAKKESETQESQPAQQYDTTFKDWIRQSAPDVLPLFLPGAIYEETLDVEIIRPTMRADKVFKVIIEDEPHIVNFEFEAGYDGKMASRLLAYNAVLYHDYELPVISIIIYPFQTTIAKSPLYVTSKKGDIIIFHFTTLPLFLEDAERYVREHIVSMYALIPTMKGVNRSIMKQVITELTKLYRNDEVTLSQQIVWLKLLLERTDTVPLQEKSEIQKELKMFDKLFEESPMLQEMRAESMAKGKIQALQSALVTVVKARFPELTELAREQVTHVDNPAVLDVLLQGVSTAPEESVARWVLTSLAA